MHFVVKKDGAYTLPQVFTRPLEELKAEGYDKHVYSSEVTKTIKQINECLTDLKKLLTYDASYEEAYKTIRKYFEIVEDDGEEPSSVMIDCSRPLTSPQITNLELVVEKFDDEPINVIRFFMTAQSDVSNIFDSYNENERDLKPLKNYANSHVKKTKAYKRYCEFCAFFVNNYWEEIKQVIKVK